MAAVHRVLLSVFTLGVVVQFFLAGLGVFRVRDGASRVFVQSVLANNGPSWVRAFHPVVAVVILALAGSWTGRLWREHRAAPAG